VRVQLRLLELRIPSIESLRLADRERLNMLRGQVETFSTMTGVRFFGAGDRLKPLSDVDQLVQEFGKYKADSYVFADAQDLRREDPGVKWSIGIRRALLTVTVVVDAQPSDLANLADELIALDTLLVAAVTDAEVDRPFSFLEILDTDFEPMDTPRFPTKLSALSVVDLVHLDRVDDEADHILVEALRSGELIPGAKRAVRDDLLIVRWIGEPAGPLDEILGARHAWYSHHAVPAAKGSLDQRSDTEFVLEGDTETAGLTAYSALDKRGAKAVVFDSPEEVREILDELRQVLDAGRMSDGRLIDEITLITPTRDDALRLRPVAESYGMDVVYVGDDDRLWNPSPGATRPAE
jgi:hypothetical protein